MPVHLAYSFSKGSQYTHDHMGVLSKPAHRDVWEMRKEAIGSLFIMVLPHQGEGAFHLQKSQIIGYFILNCPLGQLTRGAQRKILQKSE